MSDLEFLECESCAKKSGTPPLCGSCLHNRKMIEFANRKITRLTRWFNIVSNILDLERENVIR